jgi:hypothetical protein
MNFQTIDGKMEQLKNEFSAMLSDKMAALGTEIGESVKRAIEGNQLKLDNIWGQLMIKVSYLFFYNIYIPVHTSLSY